MTEKISDPMSTSALDTPEKKQNDTPKKLVSVGPLANLKDVARFQKRVIKGMALGKLPIADGQRIMQATWHLTNTLRHRDLEKKIDEARGMLEEAKKLRTKGTGQ